MSLGSFAPYVPRLSAEWSGPGACDLDGSLLSLDVSGFTALSERLQARGRAGAEELVGLISGVFEGLIGISDRFGVVGDVVWVVQWAVSVFSGRRVAPGVGGGGAAATETIRLESAAQAGQILLHGDPPAREAPPYEPVALTPVRDLEELVPMPLRAQLLLEGVRPSTGW